MQDKSVYFPSLSCKSFIFSIILSAYFSRVPAVSGVVVVEAFGWTEFQSVFSGRPPVASLNNATDDGAPLAFLTFFAVLRNRYFRGAARRLLCSRLVLLLLVLVRPNKTAKRGACLSFS